MKIIISILFFLFIVTEVSKSQKKDEQTDITVTGIFEGKKVIIGNFQTI